jgi:hypothetical protein
MQAPGYLDLICYQGANFDYTLTWKTDGTAVNLTSYTARMQVRETYQSSTAALSFTNGSGITLGGTAGTILVAASATVTAGVAAGDYVYDLEMVNSGTVTRLIQGKFKVDPEVTR